jgi:hypothetical protein
MAEKANHKWSGYLKKALLNFGIRGQKNRKKRGYNQKYKITKPKEVNQFISRSRLRQNEIQAFTFG